MIDLGCGTNDILTRLERGEVKVHRPTNISRESSYQGQRSMRQSLTNQVQDGSHSPQNYEYQPRRFISDDRPQFTSSNSHRPRGPHRT